MTGLRQDLDAISDILHGTFKAEGFKRDYDSAFAQVAGILRRYGMEENPRNLRFRFILCMQEFFDGIPQDSGASRTPRLSSSRRSLQFPSSGTGSLSR